MGLRGHPGGAGDGDRRRRSLIDGLRTFHAGWSWVAIVTNAVAGVGGLLAWGRPRWRGRWLWILTAMAEAAIVVQVTAGAALLSAGDYEVPGVHTFYGFVAVITVMIGYSSRDAMRGRLEIFYGLIGLFLMGLAVRAVQAT